MQPGFQGGLSTFSGLRASRLPAYGLRASRLAVVVATVRTESCSVDTVPSRRAVAATETRRPDRTELRQSCPRGRSALCGKVPSVPSVPLWLRSDDDATRAQSRDAGPADAAGPREALGGQGRRAPARPAGPAAAASVHRVVVAPGRLHPRRSRRGRAQAYRGPRHVDARHDPPDDRGRLPEVSRLPAAVARRGDAGHPQGTRGQRWTFASLLAVARAYFETAPYLRGRARPPGLDVPARR